MIKPHFIKYINILKRLQYKYKLVLFFTLVHMPRYIFLNFKMHLKNLPSYKNVSLEVILLIAFTNSVFITVILG